MLKTYKKKYINGVLFSLHLDFEMFLKGMKVIIGIGSTGLRDFFEKKRLLQ